MFFLDGFPSGLALADEVDDGSEDIIENDDEEADATVETDEGPAEGVVTDTGAEAEKEEEEEEEKPLKPSPDADTHLLFTKPIGTQGTVLPFTSLPFDYWYFL